MALLAMPGPTWAQTTAGLLVQVQDSATGQPLGAATVGVPGTATVAQTDGQGRATLSPAPAAGTRIVVSLVGYRQVQMEVPAGGVPLQVRMGTEGPALEEVVITSTRTNARLEDLPTRVEVLGEEELTEENGIKPGNIASLLGDIAGTQIQPTSPTTGNADLRIQGLQGRYAQILRDGMPILGGYAGGFSILQIPPLDLRQAELIKGSSSTLYGGGAIAGLVNLVSKAPVLGQQELSATANQSTLQESNLNVFTSGRGKRMGYTFFAGGTRQRFVDVNKDGYTDVPDFANLVVHPRLFIYPRIGGKEGTLVAGYTGTTESRWAGRVVALENWAHRDTTYFTDNFTRRHTADLIYTQPLGRGTLTAKGVISGFRRRVMTNTVGFGANQRSYFSELSYLLPLGRHSIVLGANYNGEALRPGGYESALQNRYDFRTVGAFGQAVYMPTPTTTVEAGLRLDHHSRYGNFLLPRLALLQKVGKHTTLRLNGGLGYRAVVPYVNELDERAMPRIVPLTTAAERSAGCNGDVTYKGRLGDEATLTLSQGFFYTRLANPAELQGPNPNQADTTALAWVNASGPLISRGLESYLRLQARETELYLGYVYTQARRQYDALRPNVELAARHKVSTVLVHELGEHWGVGIEASYIGAQYVDQATTDALGRPQAPQRRTPGYVVAAAMVRYRTGRWTVVLNGENLNDYRQTRREAVLTGPTTNPSFGQLWAPIEGRVINLSVTYRLVRPTQR